MSKTLTVSNTYGKNGGAEHSFIIDTIRSLANAILRHKDNKEFACICAEPVLHHSTGQGRLEGAKYPDVMFIHQDGPIMVEVGKYQVSKWRCPVIHIEFDKTITTINWVSTRFTAALLRAVTVALSCVKTEDDLDYYVSQVCHV